MTKADIVNEISKQTGVEKAQVQQIVEAFMESVKNALIENKDKKGKDRGVFLRGFGSFIIKDRAPKVARNITEVPPSIFPLTAFLHSSLPRVSWRRLRTTR